MTDIADDVKAILAAITTPTPAPAPVVDFTPVIAALDAHNAAVLAAIADVKAQLEPTPPVA